MNYIEDPLLIDIARRAFVYHRRYLDRPLRGTKDGGFFFEQVPSLIAIAEQLGDSCRRHISEQRFGDRYYRHVGYMFEGKKVRDRLLQQGWLLWLWSSVLWRRCLHI